MRPTPEMNRLTRAQAIRTAQHWVEQRPLYLDTETTGLGPEAEAVQLAIVAHDGLVAVDELLRPTVPIQEGATAVHHIQQADVEGKPRISEIIPRIQAQTRDQLIVIYNAPYDTRILAQSLRAAFYKAGTPIDEPTVVTQADHYSRWPEPDALNYPTFLYLSPKKIVDAMLLYSEYHGDWDDYHGNYRWLKLELACRLEGIPTEGIALHNAAGDCELTRRLVEHIANQKI